METKGFFLFLFLWILPLLLTISLISTGYWVINLTKGYKTKLAGEYQPKTLSDVVSITAHPPSIVLGKGGGLKFELNTNNEKERLLEAEVPIQSLRFTKPKEQVIRPDNLPIIIECEKSARKRLRNKLMAVPRPRIVVKRFTEKGIIWDEDNTAGIDIAIEFCPKQLMR